MRIPIMIKEGLVLYTCLFAVSSCNKNFINPLQGSINFKNDSSNSYKQYSKLLEGKKHGNTIYLIPTNNYDVIAVANGKIASADSNINTGFIIVSLGKITVGYGNLEKCYVKKGDSIIKGQLLGAIFPKKSGYSSFLQVYVEKDENL